MHIRSIPIQIAQRGLLTISTIALVYHLLIVTRLIPYTAAWGGRLQNLEQMYVFETISIIVQLGIVAFVQKRCAQPDSRATSRSLLYGSRAFAVIFILNTLGNLAATSIVERAVFTPLTLVAAVLFLRLGLEDSSATKN